MTSIVDEEWLPKGGSMCLSEDDDRVLYGMKPPGEFTGSQVMLSDFDNSVCNMLGHDSGARPDTILKKNKELLANYEKLFQQMQTFDKKIVTDAGDVSQWNVRGPDRDSQIAMN